MKKYKRKAPMFSAPKTLIVTMSVGVLYAAVRWLNGEPNVWTIILGAFFTASLITYIFLIAAVGHKYTYTQTINLFYCGIKYRTVKYEDYSCVLISNASYNNGFGYGIYGNIPMQYKERGGKAITYPFLTLNKADYPIEQVKSGMSSRDLFILDSQNIFCLGIAWFDSLAELLSHTNIPVYILSDVYARFKKELNEVFTISDFDFGRLHIVD